MKNFAPATCATAGRSWPITVSTPTRRSSGLSWMNIRAVFSLGLLGLVPAKPTTAATAGFFRITAESWCSIRCIAE